jgi:pSer/pThr/pTyr-binding forkhead associated (FHA) protein
LIPDIPLPVSYDWVLLGSRLIVAALLLMFFWRVLIVVRREAAKSTGAKSASLGLLLADGSVARVFRLSRRRTNRIGRDGSNDIVLADPSVSGQHAAIHFAEGTWVLADAGSRNGTFLNGGSVGGPIEIQAGDVAQFGAVRMGFIIDETGS